MLAILQRTVLMVPYFFPDSLNYKLKIGRADHEDLPYLSSLNITFWISVHEKDVNQLLIGTTEARIRLFQLSDESDKIASEVAQSELVDAAINAKVIFLKFDIL